eukprot:PhM_4_TR16492/c0_g1_i1/m.35393
MTAVVNLTGMDPGEIEAKIESYQQTKASLATVDNALRATVTSKDFLDSFQAWIMTTKHQFDAKYTSSAQLLTLLRHNIYVPPGDYWNTKMLARHCNLSLDQKRLLPETTQQPAEERTSLADAIKLTSVLNALKHSKLLSQRQGDTIEAIEGQLKNVILDNSELRLLYNALATKLNDDVTRHNARHDIERYQQAIAEIAPDLENCEALLEAATLNGDMALAEEIAYNQLATYERVVALCSEQYPVLRQKEYDLYDAQRRRRWSIFRLASADVGTVLSKRQRVGEACREDERKIRAQMHSYTQDHQNQTKRYNFDISESDRFLEENRRAQQSILNRIHEMFEEFQQCHEEMVRLSDMRDMEVQRRLEAEEREAGRRSTHEAFLRCSAAYIKELQATAENADRGVHLCDSLGELILEGSDSLAKRYDVRHNQMHTLLLEVQKQTFKHYTDYYLALGRLQYRRQQKLDRINTRLKELMMHLELASETYDIGAKKFSLEAQELKELRREVEDDITKIKKKMSAAKAQFEPIYDSLQQNKIHVVHPQSLVDRVNTERGERMLDFRDVLLQQTTMDKEMETETMLIEENRAIAKETARQRTSHKDQSTVRSLKVPQPPSAHMTASGRHQTARALDRYQALCKDLDKNPTPPTLAGSQQRTPAIDPMFPKAPGQQKLSEAATPVIGSGQSSRRGSVQSHNRPKATAGSDVRNLEGKTVIAMYNYSAQESDELTFQKGDRMVCISAGEEDGWYYGMLNLRTGMFPVNYVTVLEE